MGTGILEILGFVSGAICVVLLIRQIHWAWPVGICNNIFLATVFFRSRIYAAAGLQTLFIPLAVLGWYNWLQGSRQGVPFRVSNASSRLLAVMGAMTVISTAALAWLLSTVHDAAPIRDAAATVLSINAQFLLTRKSMESWYLWMAADFLYITVYLNRGLYWTVGLYLIFLGMSVVGLREWNRTKTATSHEALRLRG